MAARTKAGKKAPASGSDLAKAVRRQGERLAAVLEIGTKLSSTRDVRALVRLVIERISALLTAEAATLFLLDEAKQELWSLALRGSSLNEIRFPVTVGISGHAVRTGETVVTQDAYTDPRFNPEIDRASGFQTRSVIAVPLRNTGGRFIGVLEVIDRRVGCFSAEDVELVEAVAAQVAAVLDNVLLYEELRSQNERLQQAQRELSQAILDLNVLYEIEKAVSSADEQKDLLDRVLEKAISVTGATAGSVLLSDEEHGTLYFRSAQGARSEDLFTFQLKRGQGIAGHVAQTGETVRVLRAEESPQYDSTIAQKLAVQVGAILAVPIPGDGGFLGALELLNKPGGFEEVDQRLATLLAGQTGRAILLRRSREEEERRARLASIGQLLSGMLHDLRTPMTIIGGYVQLMAMDSDLGERQKAAGIVEKQLEHINAMTRETLAFARGERELLPRKILLNTFAAEIEEYLRKDLERTKVELVVNARYTGTARFDENKIKRVIYNIARNAAQAMGQGGKFTFEIDREGEDLVMRFADTGPGIPPEIAGKLFESFVTAGKRDGTGLGLAIVKKIVEEHGGKVSVDSRPGQGATFEVRLPAGTPG